MVKLIIFSLLYFLCSSFASINKEVYTSYDTTIAFKKNSAELLNEVEYKMVLDAGKTIKDLIDKNGRSVTLTVTPNHKESEYQKNKDIGFQRFRKITSIWYDVYKIEYNHCYFLDKKYSQPGEIRRTGITLLFKSL